ncbi:Hypothetical_protein [Hexamita inflata]|uniref:Hypothetical_protein n=1 Tax=Hexamita inflata TaxID=28002 RepID=A0ABP1I0W1_9EUKA
MSGLANQINSICKYQFRIQSEDYAKTPGSISEGDRLCKCSWYGNPSHHLEFKSDEVLDLFTASYQGFILDQICVANLIYAWQDYHSPIVYYAIGYLLCTDGQLILTGRRWDLPAAQFDELVDHSGRQYTNFF